MPKTSSGKRNRLPAKHLKVLYVCPFANYPGHFSWAATRETAALKKAGVDVTLLTFSGVIDEAQVQVPQITVLAKTGMVNYVRRFLSVVRKNAITRWMLMSFETFLTLAKAITLKKRLAIDIIHLRDGEPYIFLSHFLSLPFKDYSWLISLTASNIYPPTDIKNKKQLVYTTAVRIINNRMWEPLYKLSMKRNQFLFAVQNPIAQSGYSNYMNGVFGGRVECLPVGVSAAQDRIPKEKAKRLLGISTDKPVFLAFGAYHSGKDFETIFRALADVSDAYFVLAGSRAFGLGMSLQDIAGESIDTDRMSIRDYYVPEEEKPYYFFAADAAILSYTKEFLSTTSLLWESCRFGVPVIASDNGDLKVLMDTFEPGLLFKAQDADSLKEAIIRFIKLRPGEVDNLKANCRRFTREFSMERWAQRCMDLYDRLLVLDTGR